MADFSQEIELVKEQLAENGEMCTWLHYPDAVNPDKPWEEIADNPTRYNNILVAFFPIGQQSLYRSGTLVPRGGYTALLGAQVFVPTLKDRCIRGSEVLGIRDILVTRIAEDPILYQIAMDR